MVRHETSARIRAGAQQTPLTLDRVGGALARPPAAESSDFDLSPDLPPGLRPKDPPKPAAVLVPVVERESGLSLILTRRAAHLKTHPGQIAFPGGRVDAADPDHWQAALREAAEEIDLSPDQAEPLGTLARHRTVTGYEVEPHVARICPGFAARAAEAEVAEVFEVPLDFVLDPANFQIHDRVWRGVARRYYAVPWGPYYIWGATARMLKAFSDRVFAE